MRFSWLFTFVFAASSFGVALAQPNEVQPVVANPLPAQPPAPRPTDAKAQIELDLRDLFRILNAQNRRGIDMSWEIGPYLSGARFGFFGGQEWVKYFWSALGKSHLDFNKIEIESLEADAARVKVFYYLTSRETALQIEGEPPVEPKDVVTSKQEILDLKRESNPWSHQEKWRIVAPNIGDVPLGDPLSLRHIAFFGGQRAGTLPLLRGQNSVSNLKQIGLGAMQFVQDYDARYAFENESWRDAIAPYVKSQALFQIPDTGDFYTFNDKLSDRNLADIKQPAQTVLFYEGENEKPKFRYGGKAAICFADGHVKLVTPDEADDLEWKP